MTPIDDATFNNNRFLQVLDRKHSTPTHPSSKVNVVQVTSTADTSQEMWDRMNEDSNEPNQNQEQQTQQQDEQQQSIVVKTSMFEFHFEFGSKRPPRTPVVEEDCCNSETEEILDIEKEDDSLDEEEYSISEEQQDDFPDHYDTNCPNSISSDDSDFARVDQVQKAISTKHLPSATADSMETYENITENNYIGAATGRSMAEESMPCECKYDPYLDDPSEACGDDSACINRMMFMECVVQDCPCGRLCRNRRFQLGQYARVDVIRTEKKGYGLRALTDLTNNSFIMEYIGEVITQNEFLHRTRIYDTEGFKHYYFMTLKSDEVIDATKKGCLARFMNHSCNPNCVTQKWVIGKKMRIGIFTSRSIKAGEELTFDYKFERYGAVAQRCFCGEKNCKGFIGATNEHVEEEILTDTESSSEDDEELDIERIQPLQDIDKVQAFVKKMLNSVGNHRLVIKLLMRLKMTNPCNSHGREILKMIIRLHGLRMLKFWLGEWKHNETIVYKTLEVLEQLPLTHRNGLEDCKLPEVVDRFTQNDNLDICQLATQLIHKWAQLKCVYRIPKRHQVEMTSGSISSTDDIIAMDTSSITDSSITMDISPIMEAIDNIDTVSPPQTGSAPHNKKKYNHSRKRTKFESSRELFDPDEDYYEYIPLDITAEELIRITQYPSLPNHIPTSQAQSEITVKQHTENNEEITSTNDQNMYDYYNYYYYYYYNYYCPTQENPTLPANWQPIIGEDGSSYYYNTLTHRTQWEMPQEDLNRPPLSEPKTHPPPPIIPPPPALSPPPPPSSPPPQPQPPTSPLSALPLSPPSHLTAGKLTTPTASITEDEALGEVELKNEIGKVVTKYLSLTSQQCLWKGDKHLFKEMARKMTHYIVDKEVKSGRKIKALDGNLRVKIEKFIDTFKQL
ncbi:hypothetical protein BY458DRAFT_328323 [Sporodiniella umbellata]|nr:hypothetical protein BY458DRAFT_328323 [Sporodiniella umbellata]